MAAPKSRQELENEIQGLERQLEKAMALLNRHNEDSSQTIGVAANEFPSMTSFHSIFLLSDSALPLGAFAYSSGLESYILHNKPLPANIAPITSFHNFLNLSVTSVANTTLPYVLKAHMHPDQLETLDNDLDASTPCTVARRASVAQGMALLVLWGRAFKAACDPHTDQTSHCTLAVAALHSFSESLKRLPEESGANLLIGYPNGHLGPLWGAVCAALGVDLRQTAYIFMLNHAKAVLSAAVRASVMGPYQAQEILASKSLKALITQTIKREWLTEPAEAGQAVPAIDLWIGRHELLYSRIFNS